MTVSSMMAATTRMTLTTSRAPSYQGDEDDADQDNHDDNEDGGDDAFDEDAFGVFMAKDFRAFKARGRGRGRSAGSARSSSSGGSAKLQNKKTSKCKGCQEYGHWSGDPECPRAQSGEVPPFRVKAATGNTST